MAQTSPVAPDVLPPAPSASAPTGFSLTMDAFLASFAGFRAQLVDLAANVFANGTDAAASAASASTNAGIASAGAAAAVVAANAVLWVSGATFAQYANVIAPANGRTYRRTSAAGSGTTDPSLDLANYVLISMLASLYSKFSDKKTAGTAGGTCVAGWQRRTLNTTDANQIGGFLASDTVGLHAGTYDFRARTPSYGSGLHKCALYDESGPGYVLYGSNGFSGGDSVMSGRFSFAGADRAFSVRHYIASAATTAGLGLASNLGLEELYTEFELWKVG